MAQTPSVVSPREVQPGLPLPEGWSPQAILDVFLSFSIDGSPAGALDAYARQDCERFLHTWGLVRDLGGTALEIGANPYFTTWLLQRFTNVDLKLTNYFGDLPGTPDEVVQTLVYTDPERGQVSHPMPFRHINVESQKLPYADESFDYVLFCEVIEHLLMDPAATLREVWRILKPGGRLILTTPNVARLENVARLIQGSNMYDPYSGYGPYGRHNREYNRHELVTLLRHCGFMEEIFYTADVHANHAGAFVDQGKLSNLLRDFKGREMDLGQYLFSRSVKAKPPNPLKPSWLYRSYPAEELT